MIKLLLVVGLVVVAVSMLRHRNTMRFRAGKKLLLAAFAVLAVAAVAFPDWLNDVAKGVGVGRGADLLLYLLIVAFLFVALNTYLKFKDYDTVLTRLSRRIAIDEALRRYGPVTGSSSTPSPPDEPNRASPTP
jgi:small membrane protein